MAKIRDDLAGVVWVTVKSRPTVLRAGDTIPEGVDIDPGLVAAPPRKTAGGGSRARKRT